MRTNLTLEPRTREVLSMLKMTDMFYSESDVVDYLALHYGPDVIRQAVERGELDAAATELLK